jgi:hypothetical protein
MGGGRRRRRRRRRRRSRGGDGREAARGIAAKIGGGGAHPLVVGLLALGGRARGRDQHGGHKRAQEGAGARHLDSGGVIDGASR